MDQELTLQAKRGMALIETLKRKGDAEPEHDRTYPLRYDMNALAEVEQQIGKPVLELLGDMDGGRPISINVLRVLLWGGLLWKNRGTKIEFAGQMIQNVPGEDVGEKMAYIVNRILPAIGGALGIDIEAAAKEASEGNEQSADGTGTTGNVAVSATSA